MENLLEFHKSPFYELVIYLEGQGHGSISNEGSSAESLIFQSLFIRLTQEDGTLAWTSPIYVYRS